MKQTASTFLFLVLIALVFAAILMSVQTTLQFASQLADPTPTKTARAQPTPIAKPTPVATGAVGKRSSRLPS